MLSIKKIIGSLFLLTPVFSIQLGYGQNAVGDTINMISDSSRILKVSTLRIGGAFHPLRLLMGETQGMHITHPGANPFEPYTIRNRGLHTFSYGNIHPQILLNDMPIENHHAVSPWELAKIEFDPSAAGAADQGLRGQQGMIRYTTTDPAEIGLKVRLNSQILGYWRARRTPVLDAETFIRFSGQDFGAKNNWQRLIEQNQLSQQHRLEIHQKWPTTSIKISGQWRDTRPILKNTQSKNLQGALSMNQTLFNNRLDLSVNALILDGDHSYGEPRAFHYAMRYLPTAPIFNENDTEFGGYFEEIKFDYYNPVSIVEQNGFTGDEWIGIYQFAGSLKLHKNLSFSTLYGLERSTLDQQSWAPATSFFGGYWSQGGRQTRSLELQNDFFNSSLKYDGTLNSWTINAELGYNHQDILHSNQFVEGRTFAGLVSESTDPFQGEYLYQQVNNQAHRIIHFYSKSTFQLENKIKVDLRMSRAGSSRFGPNKRWGDVLRNETSRRP